MNIRKEESKDFLFLDTFIKEVFQTANVSDGQEQAFVRRLRLTPNYLPELAFVAEVQGEIIGHIMLTKTTIQSTTGDSKTILLLAPLSVKQEYRNQGVGRQLIAHAEKEALAQGYSAIVLVGEPLYYRQFGFIQASTVGVNSDSNIPVEYVLMKGLRMTQLEKLAGVVSIFH